MRKEFGRRDESKEVYNQGQKFTEMRKYRERFSRMIPKWNNSGLHVSGRIRQ
jgi:hypothetical protein